MRVLACHFLLLPLLFGQSPTNSTVVASADGPAKGVILHLPGTSGIPTRDPAVPGLLQVGVSNLAEEDVPKHSSLARATWLHGRKVIAGETELINPPIILTGMSRGGWLASEIAMLQPRQLQGLAIFGAGQRVDKPVARHQFKNLRVFISCGTLDENYPDAIATADLYRRRGAIVTVERHPGEGHVRKVTPRYQRWLATVFDTPSEAIPELSDSDDPWFDFRRHELLLTERLADETRTALKAKQSALKSNELVAAGLKRRQAYRALRERELTLHYDPKKTVEALGALQTEYTELATKMPETPEGLDCEFSVIRIGAIIKRMKESQRRFESHPAATKLRELQTKMNEAQAKLKRDPTQANSLALQRLAQTFMVEVERVKKAADFAQIDSGDADLGPDPVPKRLLKALDNPKLGPAERFMD